MIRFSDLRARLHGSRVLYVRLCKFLVTLPFLRRLFRPPSGLIYLDQGGEDGSLPTLAAAGISFPECIHTSEVISLRPASFAIGQAVADQLSPAQHVANARTVVTVSGGLYRNASGFHEVAILDRENRLISELSPDVNVSGLHRIYEDLSCRAEIKVPGCLVCLTTPGARNNYFHWLIELVPKLFLLREHGLIDYGTCRYVVNSSGLPVQATILALLGIPRSSLIISHPGMRLRADSLVVPTHACHYEAIPRWSVDCLAEAFLSPGVASPGASEQMKMKIFLYRPAARRRRMENLDEVCEFLTQRGYLSVDPGSLSFLEQVNLFGNADVVVAEHGAALANLVFCRGGARLLEIFSPHWPTQCYRVLAHHKRIFYGCVSGVSCSSRAVLDRLKISAGYRLPLERLEASLELLEQGNAN